jgi:hypothetical protein
MGMAFTRAIFDTAQCSAARDDALLAVELLNTLERDSKKLGAFVRERVV